MEQSTRSESSRAAAWHQLLLLADVRSISMTSCIARTRILKSSREEPQKSREEDTYGGIAMDGANATTGTARSIATEPIYPTVLSTVRVGDSIEIKAPMLRYADPASRRATNCSAATKHCPLSFELDNSTAPTEFLSYKLEFGGETNGVDGAYGDGIDPGGMYVNTRTGSVFAGPKKAGRYEIILVASIDSAEQRCEKKTKDHFAKHSSGRSHVWFWQLTVLPGVELAVIPGSLPGYWTSPYVDTSCGGDDRPCSVATSTPAASCEILDGTADCSPLQTYTVAVNGTFLLGGFPNLTFANDGGSTGAVGNELVFTTSGAPEGFMIDVQTGAVSFSATADHLAATPYNVTIAVEVKKDGAVLLNLGQRQAKVQTFILAVKFADSHDPQAHGPNGKECNADHSAVVDDVLFDGAFTCSCDQGHTGENCNTNLVLIVLLALAFIVIVLMVAVGLYKYNAVKAQQRAHDFHAELERMLTKGEIEPEQAVNNAVPREIRRSCVQLSELIGQGEFGEVWKATLDEQKHNGIPSYLAAVKMVSDPSAPEEEFKALYREAAVMAGRNPP